MPFTILMMDINYRRIPLPLLRHFKGHVQMAELIVRGDLAEVEKEHHFESEVFS